MGVILDAGPADCGSGRIGLFVDGGSRPGAEAPYPVVNPARPAEVVLEAPAASPDQLDEAVAAATRAQVAWGLLEPAERAAKLCEATVAAERMVEGLGLARLLTRENGKVLWESELDLGVMAGMAAAMGPLATQALEPEVIDPSPQRSLTVERIPQGVLAAILPFNWPVSVLGAKVLPALLAGNAVVVKTPPTCPGAALVMGAALAACLPRGLLGMLNGPGPELGRALVSHPGIDMVSFTGGILGGRAVMAAAAASAKPLVLELGGNDPAIVAPDMEVDELLAGRLFDAAFVTSGQVCMAIKRIYAPEEKVEALCEALASRLSDELVGDGLAEGVTMGPVHRREAAERAEESVREAIGRGARVQRTARLRREDVEAGGYLVSPAIVVDPPEDASVVADELFAPVLPVVGYVDTDGALDQANSTDYGLSGSVWSHDLDLAVGLARRLRVGTVFLNSHGMAAMDHRAPFGGLGASGFGVELGEEGMRAFTRPRVLREAPF